MTDDLRDLFHDAVSDVRPTRGLEDLPRSLRGRRRRVATWVPTTLVTAAVVALLLAGVSWLARPPATGPSGPADGGVSAPRYAEVSLYYVGETGGGPRLFPEKRTVPVRRGDVVQAAVDAALGAFPRDPDYRNPLTGLHLQVTAGRSADGLDLDFRDAPTLPDGTDAQLGPLLVQALVRTTQAAASTEDPVRFLVGGREVDTVFGVDTSRPVAATSDDSTLSPVRIDAPRQGSTERTTFSVRGMAATNEANVVWELRKGEKIVQHGYATAQQCCTLSPYAFDITVPPGHYRLVVQDVDDSGGEGTGTTLDSKEFDVTPGRF